MRSTSANHGLPRRVFRRTWVSASMTIFRLADASNLFAVHWLVHKSGARLSRVP